MNIHSFTEKLPNFDRLRAFLFPEYFLQPRQEADALVLDSIHKDGTKGRTSCGFPVTITEQEKETNLLVLKVDADIVKVPVSEEKLEKVKKGDVVHVVCIHGRHYEDDHHLKCFLSK